MIDQAILNEKHEVVLEPDTQKWVKFFGDAPGRTVAKQMIGKYLVSTVFLGVDHSFGCAGPALWFETMIFPDPDGADEYQKRYTTWDEAVAGHARAVEYTKARVVG